MVISTEKIKTSDSQVHYAKLDALRGLAILGVVVSHFTGYWLINSQTPLMIPLWNANAEDFLAYGTRGVSLFFLLSGYLLTMSEEARARRGNYSVRSYAARRALRLVPALWVSVLVVVVVWPTHPSIVDVLTQAFFLAALDPHTWAVVENGRTTMDAVTWSLTSELFFYCLVPLIILKLPRISHRLLLFGVLTLISLASRVYTTFDFFGVLQDQLGGFTWQYVYFLLTTHLWLFLAGVLLWTLTKQISGHRLRLLLASALLAGSVASLLTFLVLDVNLSWMRKSPTMMILELTVIGFFAAALLDAPLLRGLLSWKPLIFIGTISYSLFLLHGTVALILYGRLFDVLRGWVTNGDLPGIWAAFLICTSATLVAACILSYLSYLYVESPFIRQKSK